MYVINKWSRPYQHLKELKGFSMAAIAAISAFPLIIVSLFYQLDGT